MKFAVESYSDKGPRQNNEDAWAFHAFSPDAIAICVADGVGGNPCGEVASKICAENFIKYLERREEQTLSKIVYELDSDIKEYAQKYSECNKMASTFSGCVLINNQLFGINVGDTRVFILRGNGIRQLSQDHTEASRLIKEKLLSPANVRHYPRRNVLDMALGSNNPLNPFLFNFKLAPGDRVLITSDGVHGVIRKPMLRDISKASENIREFAEKIKAFLFTSKLKDNVTFVAAEVNY